jgi:hypothetical protein
MLTLSLAPGMLIFYCRALEIRIPITKVWQKRAPMDPTSQAAAVRPQDDSRSQPAPELDELPLPRAEEAAEAVTPSLASQMEEALARSRKLLHDSEKICQERRAERQEQADLEATAPRPRSS